jgi:hypothetical protein
MPQEALMVSVFRPASFVTAVLLLSSAAGIAQIESTPIPQTAKPNFSQMSFLMGNWRCSTKSARRPAAYVTTSTTSRTPDGYWMVTRSTTRKAPWMTADLHSEDRMTYDPSTSRWIDISTDDGGGYNVSTSPGWQGNRIVWTDMVITKTNATASTNPNTITKVSDTRTTASASFKEPSGRLVTVRTICTKGG